MDREAHLVRYPEDRARRYRELGLWGAESLVDAALAWAAKRPDAPAVRDGQTRLTYGELAARVAVRAQEFAALGIAPQDAVLLQLSNRAEFVELLLGLCAAGALPVMALPSHRIVELTHFAQVTDAVAYMGDGEEALLTELKARCPSLRALVTVGPTMEPAPTAVALPTLCARDIALFQLSGGTTGLPKAIARTHADYLCSVRQSVEVCAFNRQTRYLTALPAAHNFPLSSPGWLGTLVAGGEVTMMPQLAPRAVVDLLVREQISATALVPGLLSALLPSLERRADELSFLKMIQVGGAPLAMPVAERLERALPGRLQQVFGMAEGLVCYTRPGDPSAVRLSSQGRPMSEHDEVRLVDGDGNEVPDGQPGEVTVRGPYTICGYYRAAEHNARAFTPAGYYRTGDLAMRLPDGNLRVVGRRKDQINRAGEKFDPAEVESYLRKDPRVSDVAVVGVPDSFLGERAVAFVVPNEGQPLDTAMLSERVRAEGVALFKVPDRYIMVEAMPLTPVGKVDKVALRQLAQAPQESRT